MMEYLNVEHFSGRRAKVMDGFEDDVVNNFVDTGISDQFLKVFEEAKKVESKRTEIVCVKGRC